VHAARAARRSPHVILARLRAACRRASRDARGGSAAGLVKRPADSFSEKLGRLRYELRPWVGNAETPPQRMNVYSPRFLLTE
jgi:hypothetical protein